MSTLVKIVKRADLGHGLIAVTLRPNDDAAHDSVRTFYVTAATSRPELEEWLAAEKEKVAALYDAHLAAHAHLASLE